MVAEEDVQAAEGLISFIEQCPSMFHTAAEIRCSGTAAAPNSSCGAAVSRPFAAA